MCDTLKHPSVSYSVKEVFYTLQGEGARAGRASVFLRFTGCNLWSGRERDRPEGRGGCARWCDTNFVGTEGQGGGRFETPEALAEAVDQAWQGLGGLEAPKGKYVVCTGGEPLLQLDAALTSALHAKGFEVAVETNGTITVPAGVDWLCVSPKDHAPLKLTQGDELKLVYPQRECLPEGYEHLAFGEFFLQPMDGPEREQNTRRCVEYCLKHPRWRLSLQTHKILGIP